MQSKKTVNTTGKLNAEFLKMAPSITQVYIAVGMITGKTFDFLMRNLKPDTVINVILGIHMPTPPAVLEKLFNLEQSGELKVSVFANNFFHPKLYLFNTQIGWLAFVGSGNLTHGGWAANEEFFVKITDHSTCYEMREHIIEWEADSIALTRELIDAYTENFEKNEALESAKINNIKELIAKVSSTHKLDKVDFSRQFFKKSDFMTFDPSKVGLDNQEIWVERAAVRDKLYRLNDQVAPLIPKSWEIYPHYKPIYIASQIETAHHDQHLVRSLWVGYGRDQSTLKMYGDHETTPLYFMRMQFIIHHDTVGFWLMPAKANAGKVDRQHFREQMKDSNYRTKFFYLIRDLGDPYWIHIAGEERMTSSFENAEQLYEFVKKDAFAHYFTIGRDYEAGDPKLAVDRIAQTCMEEFTKYYPLYDMIIHRLERSNLALR
ncbi:PLD-like domain-containing protein [Pedobacter sp. ok626]|uniref:phospholipase D family protein n=1 Tax=Pedobacter sp. ok626 TaxID=1761882 RepID=UPI00088F020A|nr:phospholipase D family protein [Pedobacter sp. ok626]SDJ97807.1 PLD-like domain-containing protein [Pedobacter sp. ok626]